MSDQPQSLKVIRSIDRGGFGNVDLVETESGERLARKTFSKNQPLSDDLLANVLKRFAKEVRIQSSISHPNIVPIKGYDLHVSPPYYLMPLAEESLSKAMATDRTLGGGFVSALSDIVAGLEEMHSMQIYHRDLKPQNVLRFTRNAAGRIQSYYAVSDFGLISIKESQLSALTSTGMARQSDYYTAPEITKDLRHASINSDVYSLGCIIHDMVGTEDRVPCGEIREPGEFAPILLGCTRRDPRQRFKSARAVLDAVLSIDSASYPGSTQKSLDFIAMLDAGSTIDEKAWDSLADFVENEADPNDKKAVFLKMGEDQIRSVCSLNPDAANRIAISFSSWVGSSSFNFDYCDGLANRLEGFYENCDYEAKVDCLIAMLKMGTSHNRWYVERKFISLCSGSMDANLAKRLAIQFRISDDDICSSFEHLESSISFNRSQLHSTLVRALQELCT